MKKAILIIEILIMVLYSFAQKIDSYKDSVFVYSIVNAELNCIIDSFIIHEQQYKYYDSSVVFPMTVDVYPNYTMIQVFSGNRNDDSILIMEKYLEQIIVLYKQHLFKVTLRTNGFVGNLFERTNLRLAVNYIGITTNIKNQVVLDEIFEEVDDYWATTWIYQYKDGCFLEKWKSPLIDFSK